MAIQAYRELACSVIADGISQTFTIAVSDACALMNIADLSPVDSVLSAGQGEFPGQTISAVVTLNSRGTIVTLTFASVPPKTALSDAAAIQFWVLRNG